jgi:peptidoglycan/LPS O-acetylase OafA/YrhL
MNARICIPFWKRLHLRKSNFRVCSRGVSLCGVLALFGPYLPLAAHSGYRPDIDGLRAIAVSAVVIFHVFPALLTGGFVGVDIFFVISGFLISSIIHKELKTQSFSIVQFYSRRIRRIFPSLITVLVVCYLAGWYLFIAVEYKNLCAHIMAASSFSSNFLLYGESGYFDAASETKPLLHLWSLGIEEQFYIVWPMLLNVSWKKYLNLLTVTIALTLSSFTLNIITIKTDKEQTFYWPTTRAWELLIGACLAFIISNTSNYYENFKRRFDSLLISLIYQGPLEPNGDTLHNVTSLSGMFLIVLSMCFLTKASVFPGWYAVAPTIGTAFLILGGETSWVNRKVLSSRLLVGIGLISYPLYLWHWPLLTFTRIFVGQELSYHMRIAIIVLSILIAWITHITVEKLFRFGSFSKTKLILLCVSMMSISFMGYYTYQTDGLPNRFPEIVRDITNYEKYTGDVWTRARAYTCFLQAEQDESKFGACVDNIEKPASTAVIIWGDSHGAHLYPGILAKKPVVRLTQLTASVCPPIPEIVIHDRPYCKSINDYISKRISEEQPNTVILAGSWSDYDWRKLTRTIALLRNATVKNIYLVGPVPRWKNNLPRCLYDYFLRDPAHQVPYRMHTCLVPNIDTLDKAMTVFATKAKVNYISPYSILCNSDGCLTRTGSNASTLIMHDYAHFTVVGSTFVVSHFPKNLLNHISSA